jgi:hypothetical protein
VLRRLRQEASRGLGPPLPRPQLAVALGLDRVRMAARIAKAIVRLHPTVTLLPGVFVVALLALFVAASAEGASADLANAAAARTINDPGAGTAQPQAARITQISVLVGVHVKGNRVGQQALRPESLWTAPPYTAHLPGPQDLAR